MSHFAGSGVYAPRPGVVRASGGVFGVPGLGHGASRAVGRGWICGRVGPLGLMVKRCHEAWQGASVTNSVPSEVAESRFRPAARCTGLAGQVLYRKIIVIYYTNEAATGLGR